MRNEFVGMEVIVWSKVMNAVVVDPARRKINQWDQGWRMDGRMYIRYKIGLYDFFHGSG